jgi:hypothetical protein
MVRIRSIRVTIRVRFRVIDNNDNEFKITIITVITKIK